MPTWLPLPDRSEPDHVSGGEVKSKRSAIADPAMVVVGFGCPPYQATLFDSGVNQATMTRTAAAAGSLLVYEPRIHGVRRVHAVCTDARIEHCSARWRSVQWP